MSVDIANAQEDSVNIFEMKLEDLLNMNVSVATKTKLREQQAPAVISVITREEIINSGARDLIDVLRQVPGISFATDVQGVVGIGIRGNWAHEGKHLLLIDGQEVNESMFSSTQFGNHFDVTQIKQIEVIRGPGSSIYGGYAELGVINIVTLQGEDLQGIRTNITYGQTKDQYARRNTSFSIGQKKEAFEYSVHGFLGQGQRSIDDYSDVYGASSSMKNRSDLDPANINVGLKYKGLETHYIYDLYQTKSVVIFDEAVENPAKLSFESHLFELKYDWKPNPKWTITPKFHFYQYTPWKTLNNDADFNYDRISHKISGELQSIVEINEHINIIGGIEYFNEHARNNFKPESPAFINGSDGINFQTTSAYIQGLFKFNLATLTIGGRMMYHSQFGSAFAPRLGITKTIGKFHGKFLYSLAYRAPGIENINLNTNIKPESTRVLEAEFGYKVSTKLLVQANFYNIHIHDPIVYYYDQDSNVESYENFGHTGSRGVEVEAKFRDTWGYLNINHSFYSTMDNSVPIYEVPNNDNKVVGLPGHKFNLNGSFNIGKHLTINPSFTFMSSRYQYTQVDLNDEAIISSSKEAYLFNLFFNYHNLMDGLDIGAGVYDILNQQYSYAQPYNGLHAPLPGMGRELIIRVNYTLLFH